MPFRLFGGYEGAERVMLAVYDSAAGITDFPIALIRVNAREPQRIKSSDILGALMATGVKREILGDIIARGGELLFFTEKRFADFWIQNVDSVGAFPVRLEYAPENTVIPPQTFSEIKGTVPSMRLDAVVAELCGVSREEACRLIETKQVQIDHVIIEKRTKEADAGQTLVVRRYGKWLIDDCSSFTKKGRIVLQCRKYK